MLQDLLDVLADVAEQLTDGSAMNSGNTPAPGPTTTGTLGASGAGGGGGGGGDRATPGDGGRPGREPPRHDQPDYEQQLQRDNLLDTALDLATELATAPLRQLGKLLGPLGTVAAGSETLAEGVTTVREAERLRDQRIHEQSGGYFDAPSGRTSGSTSGASGGDGGAGSADGAGSGDTGEGSQTSERSTSQRSDEAQRILDDIEFKLQMEEHQARERYARWAQ